MSQNPTKEQAAQASTGTTTVGAPQTAEKKIIAPAAKEVKLTRKPTTELLRFSPYAYAKLRWLYARSRNEVGAFGISSIEDPTYVTDLALPKQEVGQASVEFDEDDLPNYLDDMIDKGYQPLEVFRIWIHTHPGMAPSPSMTDNKTFEEAFGTPEWAIMCIYGSDDKFDATLRINTSDGRFSMIRDTDVEVDFEGGFEGVNEAAVQEWEREYVANVRQRIYTVSTPTVSAKQYDNSGHWPGYGSYGYGMGGYMEDPDPKMEVSRSCTAQWHRDAWDDPNYIDSELAEYRRELQERGDGPFDPGEEELIPLEEVSLFFDEYVVDIFRREHLTFVCLEEDWVAYVGEPEDLVSSVTECIKQVADISRSKPIAFGDLTWMHDMEGGEPMICDVNTKYGASYVSTNVMLTLDEAELAIMSQIESGAAQEAELSEIDKEMDDLIAAEEAERAASEDASDVETQELAVADIEDAKEQLMVARMNGDEPPKKQRRKKGAPSGP